MASGVHEELFAICKVVDLALVSCLDRSHLFVQAVSVWFRLARADVDATFVSADITGNHTLYHQMNVLFFVIHWAQDFVFDSTQTNESFSKFSDKNKQLHFSPPPFCP